VTSFRIPFNRPALTGCEFDYMRRAIESGHISGDGPFTKRSQVLLEELLGVPKVLLTTSCTHALEMAALLLRAEPGDEVILPPFTFVSTVNAFVLRGAHPVFVDIRPDTLNLDERAVAARVGPRTKAIIAVHYAGVACEMDALTSIAAARAIGLVEDNAHGLFGTYKGRPLGTFGALATLSFHETKNISCGEGGALVINDRSLVSRAEILREKGTDRSRFFRGEVDKYGWVDLGSSYVPSDLLAAFLLAQLEARDTLQARRRTIWHRYKDALAGWAAGLGARLPFVPAEVEQAYHMFYVVMPSPRARADLIAHLKARGILAVFHYLPLHTSPMGRVLVPAGSACPIAESISERLVRLPFYADLSADDQAFVIESVMEFHDA
jgi:dTDP-4-amino-4,6-dideoxygalactose transaminase